MSEPHTGLPQRLLPVKLYVEGYTIDAVVKRLGMGHRRVKRLLLDAGIPLRVTYREPRTGGEDG